MADQFVLTVYGKVLPNLPYGLADEWEATLKASRDAIKHALLTTKLPTEGDFDTKLAVPSSVRFSDFLATVGSDWTKADITLKQKAKLLKQYQAWKDGVTNAFAVGGQFETQVTAKKGKTAMMKYPLGMVGNKSEDRWRFASLLALGLVGDKRILTYITAPDSIDIPANLVNALEPPYNIYDRPFIVALCTKYGVLLNYADEVGLDKTTLLASLNSGLNIIETHAKTTPPAYTITLTASWDVSNGTKIIADVNTA